MESPDSIGCLKSAQEKSWENQNMKTEQMERQTERCDNLEQDDEEATVAALAWEFCERVRLGQPASIGDYLSRCPGDKSRREFRIAVGMSCLVDAAVAIDAAAG
jgi:hypothetical protein